VFNSLREKPSYDTKSLYKCIWDVCSATIGIVLYEIPDISNDYVMKNMPNTNQCEAVEFSYYHTPNMILTKECIEL